MHARCADGLICHPSTETERKTYKDEGYQPSTTYGDQCERKEDIAEIEADRQRHGEREMLERSGLSQEEVSAKMDAVETPPPPSGPGLPVRVVRTAVRIRVPGQKVFAACRDTERLVSGSCGFQYKGTAIRAQPSNPDVGVTRYSDHDTIGARWTCVGTVGATVVAKALCQAVPRQE